MKRRSDRLDILRINVVLDCAEAGPMASFYSEFLGWTWTHPAANGWAAITSPEGIVMAFQEVPGYQPPEWPWQENAQGQMMHFDYWVDDLGEGVDFALRCGAREAKVQYFKTSRTMLDPAGHPFCIDTDEEEPGI